MRVRGEEIIKNIGHIINAVRNTGRVLHQLFKVMEDKKVEGLFTRLINKRR